MPYSLTYIGVFALTYMGIENAKEVAEAVAVVAVALVTLYGRYRAQGVNIFGVKK